MIDPDRIRELAGDLRKIIDRFYFFRGLESDDLDGMRAIADDLEEEADK